MYKHHINDIHIEVTDRCNAECPVCPRSMAGGQEMPYVKNQELGLAYFKLLGYDFLSQINHWNFCGVKGDPASAQELFEILDYILECNPDTEIDIRTNGGARNEKFWVKVGNRFKGKNCQVVWSVDGWENTNHIYRKNVKWSKLFANLNAYIKTGANSKWEFNKFAHNMEDLDTVKAFCKRHNMLLDIREPFGFSVVSQTEQHGIDRRLNPLVSMIKTIPVYKKKDDTLSVLDYTIKPHGTSDDNIIDDWDSKFQEHDINDWKPGVYDLNDFKQYKGTQQNIECKATTNTQEIYIDSSGIVYPCCFIAGKHQMGDEQLNPYLEEYKDDLIVTEDNGIYDILALDYFTKVMPDGMNGDLDDDVGYCITCVQHCGK